ncbi:hypothetical protein BC940DRAFT_346608 [Gongronella butleri]|nr:hypothetical protein BC940DRAFT_346608 [Gongronella butleri]
MDILQDTHTLFPMECDHHTNVLSRVLVCVYEFQGDKDHIVYAYQQLLSSLHLLRPISSSPIVICPDNWRTHLGNKSCYQSFLAFFDREIQQHGLDATAKHFLNQLAPSLHAQLQPVVHLTLGLEHGLAPMVSEGLAYLCSTFDAALPWLSDCGGTGHAANRQPPAIGTGRTFSTNVAQSNATAVSPSNDSSLATVLFDPICADPRFNGTIEGGRSMASKIKQLLKSHSVLLQQYLLAWMSEQKSIDCLIDELTRACLGLIEANTMDEPTHHLLASMVALRTLYRTQFLPDDLMHQWLLTQALVMMCTFIIQGRRTAFSHVDSAYLEYTNWDQCIHAFFAFHSPPVYTLAIRSLWKLDDPQSLSMANALIHALKQHPIVD